MPVVSPSTTGTPSTASGAPQPTQPQQGHGLAQGQTAPPTGPAQPGGTRHFGEALAPDATRVTLGALQQHADEHRTQTLRVEGQIVAVCQHMGCWMELRDEATQAHVVMHGHSFFLPRDVNGKRAALVGTLVAARPAAECNQGGCGQTGERSPIELDAIGIDVFN